jgi:hypothetical protein
MKFALPITILAATAILLVLGIVVPAHSNATVGIVSGSALPGLSSAASTPEQAVADLLNQVQQRNYGAAYAALADNSSFDQALFERDLAGANGGLRTLSNLQNWELQPLHATRDEAEIRATLHWSTPVGQLEDVRNLKALRQGDTWKVVWPVPHFAEVPTQVIPVNYLRWDLVTSSAGNEWGGNNLDAPHARIVSMNAVNYEDGTVVMGEAVNDDTVPAFVNVNATLIGKDGKPLDQESSFDKILHVLLPKQVTPYRIDFPNVALQNVQSVHMDIKATLVPASADPVIGVMNQKLSTDDLGRKVLQGDLLDQSGLTVNVPHVIATFYDNTGRVIWVADGYVERALLPGAPENFSIVVPSAIAAKVQNYHVVVNQFSLNRS